MDEKIIAMERSSEGDTSRENRIMPDTSHKSHVGISNPDPGHTATISTSHRSTESHFLNVCEVAEYLHISRSMVYKMIERRQIPVVRVGRLLRISRRELDQTLRNQAEDR